MTEQLAAGPKTEDRDARCERVSKELESHFRECGMVLRDCAAGVERRGEYRDDDFRRIATFLRTSAQLASTIARLETVKIRTSNPQ